MKRLNTKEFIKRAKQIHGDKYDYSKVEYVDAHTKVCIICPEHGEFWQKPSKHLIGQGCNRCKGKKNSLKRLKNQETFIEQAKKIHGDKYDYSKVKYTSSKNKVCIICPEHGEFWQESSSHLSGCGCPKCAIKNRQQNQPLSLKDFIQHAKQVYGEKYNYSKVNYINSKTKVCIICPEHGEFWQTPDSFLQGHGCQMCSKRKRKTREEFINECKMIHHDKYDYSKVVFKTVKTKVCIICPEHGEFWQKPSKHLIGQGCPKCSETHLEEQVISMLEKNNINYDFNRFYSWLDNLQLDFFIPSKKIAIECQGGQHFKPVKWFGGENGFIKQKERDERKRLICEKNDIKLLYFSDLNINYPYEVITNINILENEIKKDRLF